MHKDKAGIEAEHSGFIGTENYHRFNPLLRKTLATDGLMHIAETYGAYWLLELIGIHMAEITDHFCVIRLFKDKKADSETAFIFEITDDIPAYSYYVHKEVEYSDFPQAGITLYAAQQEDNWIIMLPSEY